MADTSPTPIETQLARADEIRRAVATSPVAHRADWLDSLADALDQHADELVPLAHEETSLGTEPRLAGELRRTTFQARLFAHGLRDGSLVPRQVDLADESWGMGPRPDLRRTVQGIGPVLVFAASNFPFAFSVCGGDTVSAIAAGCPVTVKAHPGHPRLSRRTADIASAALTAAGAPEGLLQLIEGTEESLDALRDPRILAAAFTGSTRGGRALAQVAADRPDPIPFYGELGSVNPVVVTPAAAEARLQDVRDGWVASLTLGVGQFCTNPGLLLVPDAEAFVEGIQLPTPAPMLNERIEEGYRTGLEHVSDVDGVRVAITGSTSERGITPSVLVADRDTVLGSPELLGEEIFGPAGLVVGYGDADGLAALVDALPGQLTCTVQTATDDDEVAAAVLPALAERAGRVVWNEWPTGVSVTAAQQHGGPWPATTAPTTTSVGTAAISRFQRPVAYQNVPQALLPENLRD